MAHQLAIADRLRFLLLFSRAVRTLNGLFPLLTLVSAEFPGVRMCLFSWAEPLVRSVVKS